MGVLRERFGTMPDGTEVYKYILNNKSGVSASFLTLGGVWVSMMAPDRKGSLGDVVLGYDDLTAIGRIRPISEPL